jgi:hypothetical protein
MKLLSELISAAYFKIDAKVWLEALRIAPLNFKSQFCVDSLQLAIPVTSVATAGLSIASCWSGAR